MDFCQRWATDCQSSGVWADWDRLRALTDLSSASRSLALSSLLDSGFTVDEVGFPDFASVFF